ncbi:MAG TPA: glycosyltransferase, partial [Candidatus Limnocylindrales bacterium]
MQPTRPGVRTETLGATVFRDGSLPPPETPVRRAVIHGVALAAIVVTAIYLIWRLTSTIALEWWWVAIPLFIVEVHNAFGLVLYTVALWTVDAGEPPSGNALRRPRVAVLIPTYNEPPDVLLPTIAAAVALKPKHETWVLDDGNRDDIRRLAETLGARYLARSSNAHAK